MTVDSTDLINLIKLREIEEEIFEVLYDIAIDEEDLKTKDNRIKMGTILEKIPDLTKAQLTNIIRRKLERITIRLPNEDKNVEIRLLDYIPYEGVRLTKEGLIVAEKTARNHRLAGAILFQIFDMDLEVICEQACYLEHGITDQIAESIVKKIKYPFSPFGKPIPNLSSERIEKAKKQLITVDEAPIGVTLRVIFLGKRDKRLIHKVKTIGIRKSSDTFIVTRKEGDNIVIRLNNGLEKRETYLNKSIAKLIYCEITS